MRVLLTSPSYPSDELDWRGVFIRHMVDALARSDGVQLGVWAPPGELPADATAVTTAAEEQWLRRLMSMGGISHLMRQGRIKDLFAPVTLLWMLASAYRREFATDIYHINWLQCALPLPNDGKPALVTALGNDLKLLRLPLMRRALRRVMRGRKTVICPNAEWMTEPLQAAFGDVADVVPVSFGIDTCWYAIDRDVTAYPTKQWLAVTRLTADKLGPLFDWSKEYFQGTERKLHLFGPMQESVEVPNWVQYHGAATPRQLATDWFPYASGLITLSRHAEGRPQVMLEAMAAGLPIIASRMPAHASIVNDKVTGMLCDNPEDYGHALTALENTETNRHFGSAARNRALHEFGTWRDCALRYTGIYKKLLEGDGIA
ncbi:glycosyltransferase family 4 protein [Rhodanobacter hydrolyticus]|uniref:Glycosyltransferase family 4 protein n=1 Tax=Rhodanobacter hydrolyticus TaxID=2250595 RepID=A0ABW8J9X0_9GAMM